MLQANEDLLDGIQHKHRMQVIGATLYHVLGFQFFGAAGSALIAGMVLLVHTGILMI